MSWSSQNTQNNIEITKLPPSHTLNSHQTPVSLYNFPSNSPKHFSLSLKIVDGDWGGMRLFLGIGRVRGQERVRLKKVVKEGMSNLVIVIFFMGGCFGIYFNQLGCNLANSPKITFTRKKHSKKRIPLLVEWCWEFFRAPIWDFFGRNSVEASYCFEDFAKA